MTDTNEKKTELLQGKVAGVLNERELVINIGASDGVQVGMKFRVLSDQPVQVLDPETDELLGEVDREKVRVKVVEAQDKLSVCRTYRTHYVPGGPLYQITMAQRNLHAAPERVDETLKVEGSEYLPPLSEEESYVKRGDRVVELKEEEE